MKNCLVLLTKIFPFDTGEEFIANELPVIAKEFEKVILIATSVSDNPVQTRPVPDNTEVHTISAARIGAKIKVGALVPFLHIPKKYKNAQERAELGHALIRRLYFAYFVSKGKVVSHEAAAILAKTDIDRYDSVTFYSYWFYDTAFAAMSLKHSCKAAHSYAYSRAHGYDLYPERNPSNYLPLRPYLLQSLDAVFPCSNNGSKYLKETYKELADKVATAYLGTRDYGTGPSDSGDEFCIASCCHIVPVKRVELLAQALAKLSESGLSLKWTHFGGGEGLDELKKYAEENLSFMKCEFTGEVKNEELMKFYETSCVDCFINTSSSEGLPVSIMEACSFGIPVIATDVGGTGEIVKDGKNGWLLAADFTPETLAQKIEQMARLDQQGRIALRESARNIWQENFCAENNYARFAQLIDPLHS